MRNDFRGIIWTNHALDRLKERGISQGDAYFAFNSPDESRQGTNKKGSSVYFKTYNVPLKDFPDSVGQKIEVVAKKNEEGEWIILSVWARPIYPQRGGKRGHSASKQPQKQNPIVYFINWIFNKHK